MRVRTEAQCAVSVHGRLQGTLTRRGGLWRKIHLKGRASRREALVLDKAQEVKPLLVGAGTAAAHMAQGGAGGVGEKGQPHSEKGQLH